MCIMMNILFAACIGEVKETVLSNPSPTVTVTVTQAPVSTQATTPILTKELEPTQKLTPSPTEEPKQQVTPMLSVTITPTMTPTSAENNDFSMSMFGTSQDPANQIYMSANALQSILDLSEAGSETDADTKADRDTYTSADSYGYANSTTNDSANSAANDTTDSIANGITNVTTVSNDGSNTNTCKRSVGTHICRLAAGNRPVRTVCNCISRYI